MIPSLISQTNSPYEGFFAIDKSYLRKALVSGIEGRHGSNLRIACNAVLTAIKAICCAALDALQHAFKAFAKTIGLLPYSFYWANQVEMPRFTPVHMLLDIPKHVVMAAVSAAMIVIVPIPAAMDPQLALRCTKLIRLTPDTVPPKVVTLPCQPSEIGTKVSSLRMSKSTSTPAIAPELYQVRPVTEKKVRFSTEPILTRETKPESDIQPNNEVEAAQVERINKLEEAAAKSAAQFEGIVNILHNVQKQQLLAFKATLTVTIVVAVVLSAIVHFAPPSLGFTSPFTHLWRFISP